MEREQLRTLAGNIAYGLANSIIEQYSGRGFYFDNPSDMDGVRVVNSVATLLDQLHDLRGPELSIKVNSMIHFSPEFKVISGGLR